MKQIKISVFAICLLLSLTGYSQKSFIKVYNLSGYDQGYSLVETPEKNILITGYTQVGSAYPLMVLKVDSAGDSLNLYTFTENGDEGGYHIKAAPSGGYLVTGYTNTAGQYNLYALKLDNQLNKLWSKTITEINTNFFLTDPLYDGIETSDGFNLFAAYKDQDSYAYLLKRSSVGDSVWSKKFRTFSDVASRFHSVIETSDNNYLAVGKSRNNSFKDGGYIVKTDKEGVLLAEKTFGSSNSDHIILYSVIEVADGYIAAGSLGTSKIKLLKYNKTLSGTTPVWNKDITISNGAGGAITEAKPFGITLSDDGNVVISGYYTDATSTGTFIIKADLAGNVVFNNIHTSTVEMPSYDIISTYDGGYAMTGYTDPSFNTHLIKTDGGGKICNNFPYILTVNTPDTAETGIPVTFTPNINGGNGTLDYTWTGTGGFSSTSSVPSHTYTTPGTYTYSLSITDANTCTATKYSGSLVVILNDGVNENKLNDFFTIENPACTTLKLTTNNVIQDLKIVNTLGETVKYVAFPHSENINISELTPGIYFLIVQDNEKNKGIKKLIISK